MTTATMKGPTQANGQTGAGSNGVVIDCKLDKVFYGDFLAVRDSHVEVKKGKITGFIGPSGCGKSTVLRSLNRMNDLIRGFRFQGHVHFHGKDVYDRNVDPVAVRRYIGMPSPMKRMTLRAFLDPVSKTSHVTVRVFLPSEATTE